jgi:NAD(P)-dependent dehydrogenase (short-subunit alcohol dehydrogenase family)
MTENTGRMAGKVAIVTGGNSGMGASTVELFLKEGAQVVIAARGEEAGQALAQRLGENAIFHRTDVSVEADVKVLVDTAIAKWGRLDVLFNNAGIGQSYVLAEEFTMEDFDTLFKANLASCFLGIKYAVPIMKQQGGGSIINNGSVSGVITEGSGPLYSGTKAAVIHMTKVWAVELAEHGIRVNCISPGAIVTPIFWGGHQTQSDEENSLRTQRLTEFYDEDLGLGAGTPEDIAYAALYLASDESRHTTGLNMRVDAGLTCHNRPWRDIISRSEKRNKQIEVG